MPKAGRKQANNASAPEEMASQATEGYVDQDDADEEDVPSINISDGEIAKRAYYIYLERGGEDGNAFDDWIQAEHELRVGREA
ncbi:MAG TPA: DUF2934 domain-containing protein [Blastocatellia bacterium]|nr:DUF2934 domain-containing protein [Blastocatellia bacterium]